MIGQKDVLMLDASIFKLTKRCFKVCYRRQADLAPVDPSCFGSCVENYVSSRAWVKEKLLSDIDEVLRSNEEVYKDFYK